VGPNPAVPTLKNQTSQRRRLGRRLSESAGTGCVRAPADRYALTNRSREFSPNALFYYGTVNGLKGTLLSVAVVQALSREHSLSKPQPSMATSQVR
jgi:hypothetical protein